MKYIYETHLHTCTSSACGKSKGYEYISFYKDLGYTGIFVTDHFFNGNSAVPRDLPWKERIEQFFCGYEEAKAEGDKQGLQVFFALEDRYAGDEYLVYGLTKEWLIAHPDMLSWDHITHYKMIHEAGGLVIQAHPFRERDYIHQVDLHPFQCDGWEVANAGNLPENDRLAYHYAKLHNMPMSAGSDIHEVGKTGMGTCFGVAFDTPLADASDYVARMLRGEGSLHVPTNHLDWDETSSNHLPLFLYDEHNLPKEIKNISELF